VAVATLGRVVAELGDSATGSTYLLLGTALVEASMHEQSEAELRTALVRFRADGDRGGEARTIGILGTVIGEQRRLADAEDALREGQTIAREIGYRIADAECTVNLATIMYQRNRPAAALVAYEEAEEAFRSIGQQRGVASAQSNQASVALQVFGDADAARDAAQAAADYFSSVGESARLAVAESLLAGVSAIDDPAEAITLFEQAVAQVLQTPDVYRAKIVFMAYLDHLLDVGDSAAASAVFTRLDEIDPGWGSAPHEQLLKAWQDREAGGSGWIAIIDGLLATLDGSVQVGARIAYGAFLVLRSDPSRAREAIDKALALIEADLEGLDADREDRARSAHLFVKIRDAHAQSNARRLTIAVRRVGTPGGRQPKGEEVLAVAVTPWVPSDEAISSHVDRRRFQLERVIGEFESAGASPSIKHLARALDVSHSTVKRDLSALRSDGRVSTTS
jgi:tetratricopeptide (TPR) repeat protein